MGGTAGTAESPSKRDLHRVTTQEKLFQSEFNAPAGHCSMLNAGEVRWTLRGYLPPKHLRIPGYDYGRPEDHRTREHARADGGGVPAVIQRRGHGRERV